MDGQFTLFTLLHVEEKLQTAIQDSLFKNIVFEKVFEKDHVGCVCCMGLGVTSSKNEAS